MLMSRLVKSLNRFLSGSILDINIRIIDLTSTAFDVNSWTPWQAAYLLIYFDLIRVGARLGNNVIASHFRDHAGCTRARIWVRLRFVWDFEGFNLGWVNI